MKQLSKIMIIALLLLSCTKEAIVEDDVCNCRIKKTEQTVVLQNGLPHSALVITYEQTDLTDCDLDGVVILDSNTIEKHYECE